MSVWRYGEDSAVTRAERTRAVAEELTRLPGVKELTVFVSERRGHMRLAHVHFAEPIPVIPPNAEDVRVRCSAKLPPATPPPTRDSLKPFLDAAGGGEFDITVQDDGGCIVEVNVP